MDAALVHRYDAVESTQDVLDQLAAAGAPAGTVVVAAEQRGGRGSRGRAWASPRGGLWLSMLYRPATAPALALLALRIGLAVSDALDDLGTLPPVRLKWPNDLMLGSRKVGGILCEARWQGSDPAWVVAGLGINVANPIPPALAASATRLADFDPSLLADRVAAAVIPALANLAASPGTLGADELGAFARKDWLAGRLLGAPVRGRAAGIDADGALLVELASGRRVPVRTGSVTLEEEPLATRSPDLLSPEA